MEQAADQSDRPGGVELAPGVRVPEAALRWSFARSSGPGGQNVNKLATKAELRVAVADLGLPPRAETRLRGAAGRRIVGATAEITAEGAERAAGGELVISSESERSQGRNKTECLDKLRELLVGALAEPKKRRKTRPSRSSVQKRLDSKKRRGEIKRRRGRADP